MLSKKVFLAGEPNFSAPPVHAARADVRDHVESQEGDHGASYASDRGFQEGRQTNTVFREISGAAQFSTFRQHRPKAEVLTSCAYNHRAIACGAAMRMWQIPIIATRSQHAVCGHRTASRFHSEL